MNLPFFIARKYFFSRRNPSAINIITFISILGYAVGSFALVGLMSALNGFEKVIFEVYDTYYPDVKITPVNGKVFTIDSSTFARIRALPEVRSASYCLEENAIITNGNSQVVGLIKGVDSNYTHVVKTDSLVVAGDPYFYDHSGPMGWMSAGLIYKLNIGNNANEVNIMAPRRESVGVAQMDMMNDNLRIGAMIQPGDEMNQKLLITPLAYAQELFERENEVSSIEIRLKDASNYANSVSVLQQLMGKNFKVKNRQQQNEAVYKMFNTEKWVAFAIMAFVLLIISFNLVGSLSMLVLDKKRDISILKAMGMTIKKIRSIFFSEGVLVAVLGSLAGIAAGVIVVFLQLKFGFITTNSSFVTAYPVQLRFTDLYLVLGLCASLGISGAIYPALKSSDN